MVIIKIGFLTLITGGSVGANDGLLSTLGLELGEQSS